MSELRDVHIPKLGPGTVEADLLSVSVAAGEHVVAGQEIAEVEGEKSAVVVESPVSGVVQEVLLEPGEGYAIGSVILRIIPDR